MIGRRGEPQNDPELASWATDWVVPPAQLTDSGLLMFGSQYWSHARRFCHFHADGDADVVLKSTSHSSVISLDGIFVDTIIAVGEPALYSPEDGSLAVDRQISLIEQWHRLGEDYKPPDGTYVAGGTWEDAFWRSMLGNMMMESGDQPSRLAASEDEEAFNLFLDLQFYDIGTMQASIKNMIEN
jgi:hypothetical protein